jgi:hypothetical protein
MVPIRAGRFYNHNATKHTFMGVYDSHIYGPRCKLGNRDT